MKDRIIGFVTARFIATGKDSTIREIAEGLGVSETTVRRTIDTDFPPELSTSDDWRPRASKSYGFMVDKGHYRVSVFGPSRSHLAKLVAQTRTQVDAQTPKQG